MAEFNLNFDSEQLCYRPWDCLTDLLELSERFSHRLLRNKETHPGPFAHCGILPHPLAESLALLLSFHRQPNDASADHLNSLEKYCSSIW